MRSHTRHVRRRDHRSRPRRHRHSSLSLQQRREQHREASHNDGSNHGDPLKSHPSGPSTRRMHPRALWFQINSILKLIVFLGLTLAPRSSPATWPPRPSPSFSPAPRCVITVQPWNAPRTRKFLRSRPCRHRPQPFRLRLRREASARPCPPKMLRGIVPSVRGGWSRGAVNCSVPFVAITCPAGTIISRMAVFVEPAAPRLPMNLTAARSSSTIHRLGIILTLIRLTAPARVAAGSAFRRGGK